MTAAERNRLTLAIALGAGVCLGAFAGVHAYATERQGSGSAQDQSSQQPSFRTNTTLVQADVIVRDKQRQFVEGLTAADFEILEDGKPQRIETLYVVHGSSVQQIPVTADTAASPATAATATQPSAQRVFVLMFDQAHLTQGSFSRLQPAAEQFLRTEFQQGDVGGVLMGTTMVGNRLTMDREALIAGVKSAKLSGASTSLQRDLRDWPRMSDVEAIRIAVANDSRILQQVTDRANRDAGEGRGQFDAELLVREKARFATTQLQTAAAQTVRALQALVTGLARVPGRKTIVLMTEGFMLDESRGALRQIVALAARADVRIYTLDALGLRRGEAGTDLAHMNPLETGGGSLTGPYNTVEDGPNTLAMDTGGYVIRHTNDFAGALAEVSRDTSSYYILGYSPTNANMDGGFRRIAVRVKRPGVEVRARKGYVAAPIGGPATGAGASADTASQGATSSRGAPTTPADAPPVPSAPTTPTTSADPTSAPVALADRPVVLRPNAETRVRDLETIRPEAGTIKEAASQGWERYRKGDLEGAARLLGEAASSADAAPWINYALGFVQAGLSKPREAVASWERVRTAVPEFRDVYLDLADAYVIIDDVGRALSVLREADRRWPVDADVLNALGTIQVRRGILNDALDTFEKAAERRPKDSRAYFNLGRTYELRYYRMRRFSRPDARWIDNPEDLRKAAGYYSTYLKLGGPYEAEARAGLERVRLK